MTHEEIKKKISQLEQMLEQPEPVKKEKELTYRSTLIIKKSEIRKKYGFDIASIQMRSAVNTVAIDIFEHSPHKTPISEERMDELLKINPTIKFRSDLLRFEEIRINEALFLQIYEECVKSCSELLREFE